MRGRLVLAAAVGAVLAVPRTTPAFVGDDTVAYPVRYAVTARIRFAGARLGGGFGDIHWTRVVERRVERDVLSFDGPDSFHWERALRDGAPLVGTYAGETPAAVALQHDLAAHPRLDGARYPIHRPDGICRAGFGPVSLTPDLAVIEGRRSERVRFPHRRLLHGVVTYRLRGKRI